MKIAKGTLKSHHVCVIRDSKYVTKDVKYYNSGSLIATTIPNVDNANRRLSTANMLEYCRCESSIRGIVF
jgi:hypothetical protein